jgi:hypothetical protein
MALERHELLAVRLGSGRVYLVPRFVLEDFVHACPVEASLLIVSASPTGGPLEPSGLPSEATESRLKGLMSTGAKAEGRLR